VIFGSFAGREEHAAAWRETAAYGPPMPIPGGAVTPGVIGPRSPASLPYALRVRGVCHGDRARRHGPYVYWSTRVKGRMVNRLLKSDEAELYGSWIENRKKLENVHREMLELSRNMAPLLPRQHRSHR